MTPLQISWVTEDETTGADGSLVLTSSFHILEFDAILSEDHTAESELTSHVVESAAAISDHKRPKPRTLAIEGLVTNTPLGNPPNSGFAQRSITSSVAPTLGVAKATVRSFTAEFDRIQDVEQTLDRLRTEAIDLTVQTSTRTYDNLQLIRVSIPVREAVDAREFTLGLQEVFRATVQTVEAPLPREPRGRREVETSAEAEEEEVESTLGSILNALFGGS